MAKAKKAPEAGDKAPKFRLEDHAGKVVSSDDLADRPYVLYFYPKADTPGCTKETCGFRDEIARFRRAKVKVLGVSPDDAKRQSRFHEKYEVPFPLLCDTEHDLATAYGCWKQKSMYGRTYMGIERSTFLVGADGRVARAWRKVKVPGHVEEVLAAAKELA